jgi:hypothetical protein
MNELTAHTFRTTPTGKFNIGKRRALALALIDMTGFADLLTSRRVILPGFGAHTRTEQALRFTAIMTSYLNGYPLRENYGHAIHKSTKGFQEYFKVFVTDSVPQTNQTTCL